MGEKEIDLTPPDFIPGKYRHYKGKEYEALGVACQEDTLEWFVAYKLLYMHDGLPDIWLRRLNDFIGSVAVNGTNVPRFELLDE